MTGCIECGGEKGSGRGKQLCDPCRSKRTDMRAWHRAWYHSHKHENVEQRRVNGALSRARRSGCVATLTLQEWLAVLDKYGRRCAYCLGPFEHLDHVRPLSNGGHTTANNVVPACADCNARKGDLVKAGSNSTRVPSITSRFWPRLAEELYA